jgi:non-ribosomal peptide synthetase component F
MLNRDFSGGQAVAAAQSNKERDYWLNKLSGEIQKSTFPYDEIHAVDAEHKMEAVSFNLTGELFSRLMKLSNQSDLKLHMILAAGLVVLLYKYSGIRDIIIGTPVLRQETDADFINTILALRNEVKDDMTFKEFLLHIRATIIEATENQNYPLETLIYKLDLPEFENDSFLFDVVILLENIHDPDYIRHVKYNISLSFIKADDHIEGVVEYTSSFYKKSTIQRICRHFSNVLQETVFHVERHI